MNFSLSALGFPPVFIYLKAFSAGSLADLNQTQVDEVGAGIEIWVCGTGLRSQHTSTRQRHRSQELCKERKTEGNSIKSFSGQNG